MRWGNRKDGNHDARVKEIRALGYYWWNASHTNMGVDGFAVGHGRIVPIEFKPDGKAPLSETEQKMHRILKANGIQVEIITDSKSLDVLRQRDRNFYGREAGER